MILHHNSKIQSQIIFKNDANIGKIEIILWIVSIILIKWQIDINLISNPKILSKMIEILGKMKINNRETVIEL